MKKLNLKDLQSDNPHVKYCCAKQAIALSAENPAALHRKLGVFVPFLDGGNNVLRWTALIVIGNLASVDSTGAIIKLVPRLIAFIKDASLITAGNAVKALGKIARHKPRLRKKILRALVGVEKVTYYNKGKPSPECGNIMVGNVLDVLGGFAGELRGSAAVTAFARRHTHNKRPAVKQRAAELLSRINK
ncbi:MAG: hypothetical protein WC505_01465 [Patescibacteria group bacterium]